MHSHSSSRFTLFVLSLSLAILPACGKQRNSRQLKSRGKKQIIAGSVLAGTAAGAFLAASPVIAGAGLGPIDIGVELGNAFYVLLPFAIIAAPIAVALIVAGNEDCRESRRLEKGHTVAKKESEPEVDPKKAPTDPKKVAKAIDAQPA